jgi:hypothetical protein
MRQIALTELGCPAESSREVLATLSGFLGWMWGGSPHVEHEEGAESPHVTPLETVLPA